MYVIRIAFDQLSIDRTKLFVQLKDQGIGVNVHYIPVHIHPFYQKKFGSKPGNCPVAEEAYNEILSLPIFPQMNDKDIDYIIDRIQSLIRDSCV